jgi:hypothetical protein
MATTKERTEVYWLANVPPLDEFGDTIKGEFIEGQTRWGPRAIMTPETWKRAGFPTLQQGAAHRYVREPDGRWLLVE